MCVSAARALTPASASQSMRVFITSHGSVTPGNMTPEKYDNASELLSSSFCDCSSGAFKISSTFTTFGHFIARAKRRNALTWTLLLRRPNPTEMLASYHIYSPEDSPLPFWPGENGSIAIHSFHFLATAKSHRIRGGRRWTNFSLSTSVTFFE